MSENVETNPDFLPFAVGVGLSLVFLIIDYFLSANLLSLFGLLLAAFIAGFLSKKPILYSLVNGALIALAVSLILEGMHGHYLLWPELIGKGIVGAVIGNFIRSRFF